MLGCFNIKYKILTDIVAYCGLKVVENKLDDFNSLELYFSKNGKSESPDESEELAGKMYYDSEANNLEIMWEGKAPEMIVIAVDSYIKELYKKNPNKYSKNSEGKIEPFEVSKA